MTYSNNLDNPPAPYGAPPPHRPMPARGGRPTVPGLRLRGQVTAAVLLFSLVMAPFSPSAGVVLAAGGSLAVLMAVLWRRGEPPVLLFPFLYQWSVVAIKPYLSAVNGVPINQLADFGGDVRAGAYFSFAALCAIAIGIRMALGVTRRNWAGELAAEARALPLKPVLIVTGALISFGVAMNFLVPYVAPLRQILLVLSGFGAAGVFILAYWCFKNNKGYPWLIVLMLFEIGIGLTGFFSGFQGPVLLLCLAAMCARDRLRFGDGVIIGLCGTILLLVACFWSEVKQDYRSYMNAGTGAQVVLVPIEDRIAYLGNEIATFDGDRLADGFNLLLKRHSYIDFLANTMSYVPDTRPHENGARIGRTFLHVITPRVLFPNKPPTEFDTEVTIHYTGLDIQIRQGTSISIGYLGELYIDFGIFGALAACLVGGLGMGYGWRKLLQVGRGSPLLRFSVYALMALTLSQFGFALIKYIGGAGTAFIGAIVVQKYLLPHLTRVLYPPRRRGAAVPTPARG